MLPPYYTGDKHHTGDCVSLLYRITRVIRYYYRITRVITVFPPCHTGDKYHTGDNRITRAISKHTTFRRINTPKIGPRTSQEFRSGMKATRIIYNKKNSSGGKRFRSQVTALRQHFVSCSEGNFEEVFVDGFVIKQCAAGFGPNIATSTRVSYALLGSGHTTILEREQ